MILSAKYGFIAPDFVIPGPYDVSFNRPTSRPIAPADLRSQLQEAHLAEWRTIIGLGGRHYREAICAAFDNTGVAVYFPFAGMPLGHMIRATRLALERGDPALPT